jgi:hypothetical protein
MSDWLERELSRALAPVAAPDALRIRLGFAPAKRWVFPRVALAVAAAVVMIIGGGYAASRTAALDLRREAAVNITLQPAEGAQLTGTRLPRCDGGAAMPAQKNAGNATVLLAHFSPSIEQPGHALAAAPESGCHLCHSL